MEENDVINQIIADVDKTDFAEKYILLAMEIISLLTLSFWEDKIRYYNMLDQDK